MTQATVTEVPPKLEPVTEDSFVYVVVSDRPHESTVHRLADVFGAEPRHRAILD